MKTIFFIFIILFPVTALSEPLDINGLYSSSPGEKSTSMLMVTQKWQHEYSFRLIITMDSVKNYKSDDLKAKLFRFKTQNKEVSFNFQDSLCVMDDGSGSFSLPKVFGKKDSLEGFYYSQLGGIYNEGCLMVLVKQQSNHLVFKEYGGYIALEILAESQIC